MRNNLAELLLSAVVALGLVESTAHGTEFLGMDANSNLACDATDMLLHATAGDVGTMKSIRVFIDDVPTGVFGHGCTFCVTDKDKIGNATFTYTSPTGWTNFTVFASDTGTFPIEISEFITDRYPDYKCWSISAYDFTFGSPIPANTPYAVGTLQYQVAEEGCIQWVLDGPFSAVLTTGFSTLYFEGPGETCDTVPCATPYLPAPTGLLASVDSCWGIRVSWDPLPGADSFCVRREAEVLHTEDTFLRDSLVAAGEAQYWVAGLGTLGKGDSATVVGMRLSTPPAPTHIVATDSLCRSVQISWSAAASCDSYRVYRDSSLLAVVPTPTLSYLDTMAEGTHLYAVRAGNACGWSENVEATGTALISAPVPPASASASDTSYHYVWVEWEPAPNASAYRIERGSTFVGFVPAEVNFYEDTPSEGFHKYRISAGNACGWSEPTAATGIILPMEATGSYYLDLANVETIPGADAVVPIVGRRQSSLKGFSVVVRFDADVFEVGAPPFDTVGTAAGGAQMIVEGQTDSTVRLGVVYAFSCPPEIPAGTDELVRIRLRSRPGTPPGLTYIGLLDTPPALNRMTLCDGASVVPGLFGGLVRVSDQAFVRGDLSGNGRLNITDPILNLVYQIHGGSLSCADAADAYDDGEINISDPIYILHHLYGNGPAPVKPYPGCGFDPTFDALGCICHSSCMNCSPLRPVEDQAPAGAEVTLALQQPLMEGSAILVVPAYLRSNVPLWGFEYTIEYPVDRLEFLGVSGNTFEFCSGRDDLAAGHVRVGNVFRLDLSDALPPGTHGVGEVRFAVIEEPIEKAPRILEGVFTAAGGESGPIEIGAITQVMIRDEDISLSIRASAIPNPLNGVTTIRYGVPMTGAIRVEIFSADGRSIRLLVNETQTRGFHEALWDGTADAGQLAASGVYFCRIRAGEQTETKKLVLIR
jgi:hypothetical protein